MSATFVSFQTLENNATFFLQTDYDKTKPHLKGHCVTHDFICDKCGSNWLTALDHHNEWMHVCPTDLVITQVDVMCYAIPSHKRKWYNVVSFSELPREDPRTAKGQDLAKFTHYGDCHGYVDRLITRRDAYEFYKLIVIR